MINRQTCEDNLIFFIVVVVSLKKDATFYDEKYYMFLTHIMSGNIVSIELYI